MTLYIVRHGKAEKGGEDKLRPLMKRGIKETRAAANFLKQLKVRPEAIWHSDRVRAVETAEILNKLRPRRGLIERPAMGPEDSVEPIMHAIERARGDLIIVGHLPHLGVLISKLVKTNIPEEALHISPSTIVILNTESGNWRIEAVISPSVAAVC